MYWLAAEVSSQLENVGVTMDDSARRVLLVDDDQERALAFVCVARDHGFAVAKEMLAWSRTELAGAYLIPPFKRTEEILDIL